MHGILVAALNLETALQHVYVSDETTVVFIEGRIKNTSQFELLTGPATVFMNDTFVTITSF